MVMKKKAQAAMEFLMTYGWAILVVLVVIGALAYFGVLNPQNLLPEKCTLPMGLYCKDYVIRGGTPGEINFRIENGMGSGLVFRNISVTGDVFNDCYVDLIDDCTGPVTDDDQCDYNDIEGWRLGNGQNGIVTIDCNIASYSGKTKGEITITYCDDSQGGADRDASCEQFSRTMRGEIMANIE